MALGRLRDRFLKIDLSGILANDTLDEFMSVSVPKRLIIQNRRLGVCYRILQIAFAAAMISYCAVMESWKAYNRPTSSSLVTWCHSEADMLGMVQSSNTSSNSHCMQPEAYHYKGQDSDFSSRPSSCVRLADYDACYESGGQLFLPTVVQDTDIWRGSGKACGVHHQLQCRGRSATARYDETAGSCSCIVENQYLAESPESRQVLILHGYEVDLRGGHRDRLIRGSADSRSFTESWGGRIEVLEGELITLIRTPTGEACAVGGRSEWMPADASRGIGGSLKEWLACAGVDLETDPKRFKPTASFPDHLRTMGLTLLLSLRYENVGLDTFRRVYCTVNVDVIVEWTRRSYIDFTVLPSPSNNATEALRKRLAYGVAVELRVSGRMYTYNIATFFSFLVESIVVMQLPLFIVQFISLYCMGIISEIYRSAKRTRLNIFQHFHSALSRMVLAEMGFRGIVGGKWQGSVADLELTETELYQHITDIFSEQINSGVLQVAEVRRMVAITFKQLDVNGGGSICCNEFIKSCLAGEQITVDIMARFFDDDARVGVVRKSLDSSWQHRRKSFSDLDSCNSPRESKRTGIANAVSEVINDDSSKGSSECVEQATEQYTMRKCNPRIGNTGSDAMEAVVAKLEALQNAGWEKRLAALEALGIEGRLKKLESVDVVRCGVQLNASGDLDSRSAPTQQAAAGRGSMPVAVTTDSGATSTMLGDAKIPAEINDMKARISKLDGAVAKLQRASELRATQLMDTLHLELAALARESSEKLQIEVKDLQQRFDAASHELRVRCQILERHFRGLVRPVFVDPMAMQNSSPESSCIDSIAIQTSSSTISGQQNLHQCLRSSLSSVPSLSPQGSRVQLQGPLNDSMDDLSNDMTTRVTVKSI